MKLPEKLYFDIINNLKGNTNVYLYEQDLFYFIYKLFLRLIAY